MALEFCCPQCGQAFKAFDQLAGRKMRCRQCGAVFAIPAPAARAASLVPGPALVSAASVSPEVGLVASLAPAGPAPVAVEVRFALAEPPTWPGDDRPAQGRPLPSPDPDADRAGLGLAALGPAAVARPSTDGAFDLELAEIGEQRGVAEPAAPEYPNLPREALVQSPAPWRPKRPRIVSLDLRKAATYGRAGLIVLALLLVIAGAVAAIRKTLHPRVGSGLPEEGFAGGEMPDPFFPPPADVAPPPALRSAVYGAWEARLEAQVRFLNEQASLYAQVHDGATSAEALKKLQEPVARFDSATQPPSPDPNSTERRRLWARFRPPFLEALGRVREQLNRLGSVPASTAHVRLLREQLDQFRTDVVNALQLPPAPVPVVDLLLPNIADPETARAAIKRLRALADEVPPTVANESQMGSNNHHHWALRLGPVADPAAFAARIDFAKVVELQRRVLKLNDVRLSPSELAEARAGNVARQQQQVSQALGLLESSDPAQRARAFGQIAHIPPGTNRAEVARRLESAIESMWSPQDGHLMAVLSQGFAPWAGRENVPMLLRLLQVNNDAKYAIIEALGRIKDASAIEPLVKMIGRDSLRIVTALKAIGGNAEPLLAAELRSADVLQRRGAAYALRHLGSRQCLSALEQMAKTDPDELARQNAQATLTELHQKGF